MHGNFNHYNACILHDLAHVLVPARIGRVRASSSACASLAVLAVSENETVL